MSAAGNLSAAAQYFPDVERRRCRSILEAGFLSLIPSRPRMPRDQKNGGSALDAPRFAVAVEALLPVLAPLRTKAVLTLLHRKDPP